VIPVSPFACPLFAPLHPWLDQLPDAPASAALNALAARYPIAVANGNSLRFVPPKNDGMVYECRIWESGEVETRPDNWHDFFNALVWLTFTETKRVVSACHVDAMTADGQPRGAVRDALTHFDECGIVVLSSQPELLGLLRAFEWKKLFVERRAEVKRAMRFVVFGHATYEQLLKPFRGLTAKAVLYEVSEAWLSEPLQTQLVAVDRLLAADFATDRYRRPRDFQPLPLLGIPGVCAENEDPAYYDDTWQFRPGRRTGALA